MTVWSRIRRLPSFTSATILVVVILAGVPIPAAGQDTYVFSTDQEPPVDTAWGNFQPGFDDIEVCQEFVIETPIDRALRLIEAGALMTSPGGMLTEGEVTLILRRMEGGRPGSPIAVTPFAVTEIPPTYPDAEELLVVDPGSTVTQTVSSNTTYAGCLRTGTTSVHIPGFINGGGRIFYSSDGGATTTEVPGYLLGLRMVFEGEEAEPECEGDILAQGGAGPGSNNSFFDTIISLFNNTHLEQIRELLLVPRMGGSAILLDTVTLSPGSTTEIRVSDLVPDGTFGSIMLDCPQRAKDSHDDETMMQSTIFATLPSGEQYGQFFSAQEPEDALQAGSTSLLFTTHDPDRYRVNVGITAAADGTSVTLTPIGADGTPLAAGHTVDLDNGGNTQINNVHGFFNLGSRPNVMIRVQITSGVALAYASVLDGAQAGLGTSDPTTVEPSPGGSSVVRLLELGPVQGETSEFSGSALIHNHGNRPATIEVRYYERSSPGPAATASITIDGAETRGWDDFVGEVFGLSNTVGTVELVAGASGSISAIGREFAIFRDSGGAVIGTAGQLMPGLTEADLARPGSIYHFLGLREIGQERSHLAMFNPGSGDVTLSITAYNPDGSVAGTPAEETVRGQELIRINRILGHLGVAAGEASKRLEVTVDGPCHVLVYRVNSSDDPVTISPFEVPAS